MDAQVAWDQLGSCSCWHGVTSVIMGNCGFALAPCKAPDREWFARCLEAVEDISTDAMLAGIDWNWETFPEYLANVEQLPKALNYGMYIGHSALRMYTMGERALSELASDDDLRAMAESVKQALYAGALGFSTSRATTHITPDGSPIASRIGDWSEIDHLVGVLAELNSGVFQIGPDISSGEAPRACLQRLRQIAVQCGRPLRFGVLSTRQGVDPYPWHAQLDDIDAAAAAGGRMIGQATTRPIIAVFSLKSYLPFDQLPTWREVRAQPLEQPKRSLADPVRRQRLIAEEAGMNPRDDVFQGGVAATTDPRKPDYGNLYALRGVDLNDPTVEELAHAGGKHPVEIMIDLMLADDNQLFVQPLVNENQNDVLGMLKHPRTLATFSDSGAHVCQEMGSSLQTHLLSYWVRDKQQFTLEQAVRMLTFDNASAWELPGRGLIRTGYAADLVLFDEERIKPCLPTIEQDLPGGARRLVQKAEGIAATIVNGEVTIEDGKHSGAVAGQVLKGPLANTH
jgi:N-acyl-D-aspartate/D-glutamate deacylase